MRKSILLIAVLCMILHVSGHPISKEELDRQKLNQHLDNLRVLISGKGFPYEAAVTGEESEDARKLLMNLMNIISNGTADLSSNATSGNMKNAERASLVKIGVDLAAFAVDFEPYFKENYPTLHSCLLPVMQPLTPFPCLRPLGKKILKELGL